jgi:hypothetical protein
MVGARQAGVALAVKQNLCTACLARVTRNRARRLVGKALVGGKLNPQPPCPYANIWTGAVS